MEEIKYSGIEILGLFLEKLEKLTKKEREVIIAAIDIMNHPIFITGESFKPLPHLT